MIGLIDIDSKIPNLALMKLSAYHKGMGNRVELTSPLFIRKYEKVYVSKIFDFSPMPAIVESEDIVIGGSGHDLNKNLPNKIESLTPDYSLYDSIPGMKAEYAIGYTSRGCNRRCPFCVVPIKDGKWRATGDIYVFWTGQDAIMLLDGSINTDEDHFIRICLQLKKEGILTDFNQGLDIRIFSDNQARHIKDVQLWKQIHFAWDFIGDEKKIRNGIAILRKHNLHKKSMFYVLIGFNSSHDENLYRVMTLDGLGVDPFVMPYNKFDVYQKRFARWVNHKAVFKTVKWEDYK